MAGTGFLPQLQSARGIAAAGVFLSHVGFSSWGGSEDWLSRFCSRGAWGVSLFFALSGFLLTRPWVRARFEGAADPDLRRYYWHRAVRILPAYWVALLAVLLTAARGTPADAIVSNVLLLQLYTGDLLRGFTLSWSLCTEVAFYVVLPLLALLVVRGTRRRSLVLLAALFLASLAVSGLSVAGVPLLSGTTNWLPATLLWFVVGMALAVAEPWVRQPRDRWWASATPWLVAAVVLYLVAVTPVTGDVGFGADVGVGQWLLLMTLESAISGCLLVGLLIGSPPPGKHRLLESRPMVWFGKISYAFFLWQMLMILAARNLLGIPYFSGGFLAVGLVSGVLTLAVSQLSWWFVEAPAHRRLLPLVGRRGSGAVSSA